MTSGADDEQELLEEEVASDEFSMDEIEAAYQRALEITEQSEMDFPELAGLEMPASEEAVIDDSPVAETKAKRRDDGRLIRDRNVDDETELPKLSLEQIVEAFLFVGGEGLTLKRMSGYLNQDGKPEVVEQAISNLNEKYEQQLRPYRIDLQEGGYHLKLLYEFEPIRNRVFGLAPKEVRLSQEVVEVLSFIAYKQPVTIEQLKALEHENVMSCVKQLAARDLVTTTEGTEGGHRYVTTARFLQVFGLTNIKDLPRPDHLDYK
ncbi:SMC-Scp complex subunit ScpB [Lacunimicrobium album]